MSCCLFGLSFVGHVVPVALSESGFTGWTRLTERSLAWVSLVAAANGDGDNFAVCLGNKISVSRQKSYTLCEN